ncbi:hypothetical protein POTOM_033592 [Populus tomentosa]|uniref:Uncharacterized protein n=1 Tax=Populus tomentosa TaxID=118781 RepID=A0A8X7ZGR9_POPTO|nr:hypothetical protein POTOM_033592 [Populus tomentosa]
MLLKWSRCYWNPTNPHVRYGAAFAVGISCADSGLGEAVSLPEPLTSDAVDCVRHCSCKQCLSVLTQKCTSNQWLNANAPD